MPLGDHLRTDEHVQLRGRKAREQRCERALPPDRVAIDAPDARVGKPIPQVLLDLLRPEAGVLEVRRRTLAAGLRHHHRVVAVVTARAPAVAGGMNRQRDAAVRAVEGVAALTADHGRRVSAPVQKNDHLLTARESVFDRRREIAADDDVRPLGGVLVAHVHHADRRQRSIEHPPLEHDARVLAGDGVLIRLHRRRRRAKDDERALAAGPHDGDVASVVARRLLLLVRGIVLLVDDDEAKARQRREDSGASADHRGRPPRGGSAAIDRGVRRPRARCAGWRRGGRRRRETAPRPTA